MASPLYLGIIHISDKRGRVYTPQHYVHSPAGSVLSSVVIPLIGYVLGVFLVFRGMAAIQRLHVQTSVEVNLPARDQTE